MCLLIVVLSSGCSEAGCVTADHTSRSHNCHALLPVESARKLMQPSNYTPTERLAARNSHCHCHSREDLRLGRQTLCAVWGFQVTGVRVTPVQVTPNRGDPGSGKWTDVSYTTNKTFKIERLSMVFILHMACNP